MSAGCAVNQLAMVINLYVNFAQMLRAVTNVLPIPKSIVKQRERMLHVIESEAQQPSVHIAKPILINTTKHCVRIENETESI